MKTRKKLRAIYRAISFFFRIVWRSDYVGHVSIREAIYCSGVIYDLWTDRLGAR